ncbi:MAG: twin-arginine translocase subunit TatC [Bdellovibrionales bacterium]
MTDEIDKNAHPLMAHLLDLRKRLLISVVALLGGFIICYCFSEDIYAFLVRPLAEASETSQHRLIYTGLAEAFITYLKLSLWGGLMLAFPIIASQIWLFVAPGLYESERKVFLPFLIATPVLFILGAALAYEFVFPLAWKFFLSFESLGSTATLPIHMEARVSEYLSLSMSLVFAFGMAFELPILLMILARIGVISAAKLAASRHFAIVIIFIAAAILTPPDVISQIALALPMMILYEISILGARWIEKKRNNP